MPTEPAPTRPNPAATPVLIGALLVGAVMLAALGTILPDMLDLPSPAGLVLSVALYAAAAGDVAIALWFRSKLKKAQRPSGGTVQRR